MTELECIEDKYPELTFWGIEVPNKHYHGHIEGNNVYINLLQPDIDWMLTALHESVHHRFDTGNLTTVKYNRMALMAEGFARHESKKELEEFLEEK